MQHETKVMQIKGAPKARALNDRMREGEKVIPEEEKNPRLREGKQTLAGEVRANHHSPG